MNLMRNTLITLTILTVTVGCQDFTPKPEAYPRILYPKHAYEAAPTDNCPFTFEIPAYAELMPYTGLGGKPCWYNLSYGQFDATLHLSYVPIHGQRDLDSLAEDAYKIVFKPHIQRAEEIIQREISDTTKNLRGMIYDLEGKTATPFNFYLTDGKQHFFRGSFYFNSQTTRDSVKPIYDFINEDIMHTLESFEFK